jgi:hypothetical protein
MSKKFVHKWAEIPKLNQINSDSGREYLIENTEISYPSITTVLGATSDKSGLWAWRRRVGEEEAKRISEMSTRRGTAMHSLCEQYLLNKDPEDDSIDGQMMYKAIRPYLDNIDNVRCLETAIYSHKLKVAGTVDCIAEYNGKLTIIDFKTANKPKKEEYIDGYFKQGSFYFWAYYEITGEMPEQILILISVEDGTVQEFILDKAQIIKYTEELRKNISAYYYNKDTYNK